MLRTQAQLARRLLKANFILFLFFSVQDIASQVVRRWHSYQLTERHPGAMFIQLLKLQLKEYLICAHSLGDDGIPRDSHIQKYSFNMQFQLPVTSLVKSKSFE